MTSIRVSAEGQGHTFQPGTALRIGRAPDADMVIDSPAVSPYHAQLVPDGDDAKKSKVWATVYDAKLQIKLDVDMWLAVDALSNLLFLVPT